MIDYPREVHDAGRDFWSGVLGHPARAASESPYSCLGTVGSLSFEVQQIGEDAARIHLDIESDDVPAEIARVTALGATLVEQRQGYAILRDPGGLVFCVVGVQTGERFEAEATTRP